MAFVRTRPQHTASPAAGWSVFLSETLLLGLVSVALFGLVGRVPEGRSDLAFLAVIALVLHMLVFVGLIERLAVFLAQDCPSCEQNFQAFPDRMPVPFRKRCAHCGVEATRPG